jgi:transcriptional regulator with XRE-family HTH domain
MVDWNDPSAIRRAISETGMPIGAFAALAGISRSQLDRILAGRFAPSLDTQTRIAAALKGQPQPRRVWLKEERESAAA